MLDYSVSRKGALSKILETELWFNDGKFRESFDIDRKL